MAARWYTASYLDTSFESSTTYPTNLPSSPGTNTLTDTVMCIFMTPVPQGWYGTPLPPGKRDLAALF